MFFAALVCGLTVNAKTIYLNPGTWNSDEPAYFAHSWTGTNTNEKDLKMNPLSDGIYSVDVPDGNDKIIFVRMPKGSEKLEWEKKWNQTGDLDIPSDKNQYNITGWGDKDGNWSVYSGGNGGGNEGGGNGGGNGGGSSTTDTKDYFLKGYCNGKDITTPTAEEQFDGGVLTYEFTGDSKGLGYFFILVCEKGAVVGDCYMTEKSTEESHCKLVKEDGTHKEKMAVKAGKVTFYLYDNGDGSLELSTAKIEGKTLVGGGSGSGEGGSGETNPGGNGDNPGNQGVDNTPVVEKAHKMFMDGRLVIIRGDKMFDATGRQL